MPLANKYRPKCLDDVVGQDPIVQTLKNAMQQNKLHHAYLFEGNLGSGKTSVSRILAAMENCERSPGLYPCGFCGICTAVFEGNHVDIQEIDAASGAGSVEHIRRLKQDAMFNPVAGAKTKFFIIDEAHACSHQSADALLKLIEEPPPRVRFVLATTDAQKMKATIESRCQRHTFRKIPWAVMAEKMASICKKENLNAEVAALNLCCRLANGSMRSALQNLDKLIDYVGNDSITIAHAQSVFAQASEVLYYDLFDQIIGINDGKPDASESFKIINKILSSGVDFKSVYESLTEHLRSLMVGLTSSKAKEILNFSEEGKRRLSTQLSKCKEMQAIGGVLKSFDALNESARSTEYNISADVALQKWAVESIFAFRRSG